MLFHITDSIQDVVRENPRSLNDFVEDLFSARRQGRHVIYSSPKTLRSLYSLHGLSDRARKTILSVESRQQSKRSLFKSVPGYIKVVANGAIAEYAEGDQTILEIPFSSLKYDTLFNDPVLLVENESDGQLYRIIGEYVEYKKFSSTGLRLSFDIDSGGGSQTPRRYRGYKNSGRRFVFCIVDSDRDHPKANLGSNVAGPIDEAENQGKSPFVNVKIVDCYAIENIIPPSLIQAALKKKIGSDVKNEEWFKDLLSLTSTTVGAYAPLKGGLKCAIFRAADEKSQYWLANSDVLRKKPSSCNHWGAWQACRNSCDLYHKISKETLNSVLEFFNEKDTERRFQFDVALTSMPARIRREWEDIGSHIVRWGCAGGRLSLA